jgi:hypothetical protein
MNRLVEIRKQEFICRGRALLDSGRKGFWLAKAEEWEQRALEMRAHAIVGDFIDGLAGRERLSAVAVVSLSSAELRRRSRRTHR